MTGPSTIHLYGTEPPPGWLAKLPLKETFRFHRSQVLFETLAAEKEALKGGSLRELPGPSDWPLVASTPERALLEMLDELPGQESFHVADMMMQSLNTLSPRRLQALLCGLPEREGEAPVLLLCRSPCAAVVEGDKA